MPSTITETGYTVTTERYTSIRSLTEDLAAPLSPEDQTVQSMPDASPTKWHRAHTSWFFETFVLQPYLRGYERFDPRYGFLFNSYYEAVGPRYPRPDRGLISRPGSAQVADYRRHVDAAVETLLVAGGPGPATGGLIELGLHHEQQHQELLLMDIKHVLAQNPAHPAYREVTTPASTPSPPLSWVAFEGGMAEIGHGSTSFAFDNESPRHGVYLQPFAIADRPVTCGDWADFIADDGYERADLWLSDGWANLGERPQRLPLYWEKAGAGWQHFTLGGLLPVNSAEPVTHISYYEADAYARWAGARLPTESEWERAAETFTDDHVFDPGSVHPRPVLASPGGQFGQVWEWTASAYLPYPGFRPAPGAVGEYNGKFMVNQHVLRGGSVATPPGHLRLTYRNFFPPAARWPFTGARIARDI
jgi:ergothioneine biosynthesis protein EgtB